MAGGRAWVRPSAVRQLSPKALNCICAIEKIGSHELRKFAWWFRGFNARGQPEGVAQVFNLHGVRTNLCRSAILIGQQDAILRYSEICATFSCERPRRHLWNPGNPRSKSFRVLVLGFPLSFAFRFSDFTGAWGLELGAFNSVRRFEPTCVDR
jgi:hypothetical protein